MSTLRFGVYLLPTADLQDTAVTLLIDDYASRTKLLADACASPDGPAGLVGRSYRSSSTAKVSRAVAELASILRYNGFHVSNEVLGNSQAEWQWLPGRARIAYARAA